MGNPHAVILVEDTDSFPVGLIGPYIEKTPRISRKRECQLHYNQRTLRISTCEHGERGSGAKRWPAERGTCASLVAATLLGKCDGGAEMSPRGGKLQIRWGPAQQYRLFDRRSRRGLLRRICIIETHIERNGRMLKINSNFTKLGQSYLFVTMRKKVQEYQANHPDHRVISLGIGDVTQPLVPAVIDAMHKSGRRYEPCGHL